MLPEGFPLHQFIITYLVQRKIELERFAELYARRLWWKGSLISLWNQGGSYLRIVTTLDGIHVSQKDIKVLVKFAA